ncbi:hypothetical protein C0585_00865 [Candidatus Woesearchaeota archaeon]|nr:MAG: hypothetical protein C0585_00865 [Candidatus Woesearchaeota archaeon]
MGKISPVSSKYIIHASIEINGVVDRPDVIGAIFGQTEGLLGSELELRELQRSGRIGRIEVNSEIKSGKTKGDIIIPSSLDKAETAIIGAALEIIQRIGPCNAKIKVEKIEDVRISKREFVIDRAKILLKDMVEGVMPDSQELADEVSQAVRVMEVTEYGKGKIPCGPAIEESDELLIVEGRADVVNLLKHGFKNSIAVGGTGVPEEVAELSKKKETTVFVDGDRGGDLIVKELLEVAELDFIVKAPDGKELEELTKKEIHKALRSKVTVEQYELDISTKESNGKDRRNQRSDRQDKRNDNRQDRNDRRDNKQQKKPQSKGKSKEPSDEEKSKFKEMIEDLVGTRAALILDNSLSVLGKVPVSELQSTIKSLNSGIHAVILDGVVEKDLVSVSEKASVKFLVGMDSNAGGDSRVSVLSAMDL